MTPRRRTTGFLASDEDPIDISSSPVYRCSRMAKAASRMVNGEACVELGVAVPDCDPLLLVYDVDGGGRLMAMLACRRANEVCSVN